MTMEVMKRKAMQQPWHYTHYITEEVGSRGEWQLLPI